MDATPPINPQGVVRYSFIAIDASGVEENSTNSNKSRKRGTPQRLGKPAE
jgi:hypothetical protein